MKSSTPGRVLIPHSALRIQKSKCQGDHGRCRADRKSTRLNSSHLGISYAVFCLKKQSTLRAPQGAPPFCLAVSTSNALIAVASVCKVGGWADRDGGSDGMMGDAFFFLNDPAPPEIYPLSLHDALPICSFRYPFTFLPVPDAPRPVFPFSPFSF